MQDRIARRRAIRDRRKAKRRQRHVDRTARPDLVAFCRGVLDAEAKQREVSARRADYRARRRRRR